MAPSLLLIAVMIASVIGMDMQKIVVNESESVRATVEELEEALDFMVGEIKKANNLMNYVHQIASTDDRRFQHLTSQIVVAKQLTSGSTLAVSQSIPLFEMLMNQNGFSWNEFFVILVQWITLENYNFAFDAIASSQGNNIKQAFNHSTFAQSVFKFYCAIFEKFEAEPITQPQITQLLGSMIRFCEAFKIKMGGCLVWEHFFGTFTFELETIGEIISIFNAHKAGAKFGIPLNDLTCRFVYLYNPCLN